MDTALKTEGNTHMSRSSKPLAGGSVLLPGVRCCLPIAVTCNVQTPGSSNVPSACLKFCSQCRSSGSQIIGQKASLKFREMIAAATSFYSCIQRKLLWNFYTCLIFWRMFPTHDLQLFWVYSLFGTMGCPPATEAALFLSRTHLSSLDVVLKAPPFCSWSLYSVALSWLLWKQEGDTDLNWSVHSLWLPVRAQTSNAQVSDGSLLSCCLKNTHMLESSCW